MTCRITILSLAMVFCLACPGRSDETDSGLVQERFVTKDHITAPTGVSVSPEGVVFVSCDINGATDTRSHVGRVVRCEDTDGDGSADTFSDFVSGIDSPRGSCYVDNTLYLMQPPLLVAYQDRDADGIAETSTTLVSNLGEGLRAGGVIHSANGVRMGIDGWLYMAIGDQGCYEATGTDGSKVTLHGGGVLRVRPDGTQLSVLVTGTRNIYDLAVDPYLDLFARDNTNDGGGWGTRLHHLTELADFGYPSGFMHFGHEHMQSLTDYGNGAGTGMYYLHEPGFPGDLGGALYSGDLNTGLAIHRRRKTSASYQVQQEQFMNLPKIIDMDVDGNSRMYCASRLGGGFGFARESFGHIDLIQPKDRSNAASFPNINTATDAELLTYLASRSQVTRINTMREMVTRGSRRSFTRGLETMADEADSPLYVRVAAVMTLKQLDGARSHAFLKRLYDDTGIREFVVRALGDVASEIDDTGMQVFMDAIQDENPRVQMRAIVALARSSDERAAAVILPLAKQERMIALGQERSDVEPDPEGWSEPHRVIPHTALQAVVRLGAVELMLSKLDDKVLREVALRGLQQIHNEQVVSGLAEKIDTSHDKQLARLITIALFRLYHREAPWDGRTWWRSRPNFNGPYVKCATWEQTPAVQIAIETSFQKVDPKDYRELFKLMRLNQIPEDRIRLEIEFDEALELLNQASLNQEEFNFVMDAAVDISRPEHEKLLIYDYFKRGDMPDSFFHRVHILRQWGEEAAEGALQRQAYLEFVSGHEFIGNVEALGPFLGNDQKDSHKFAHIQLLNLIHSSEVPQSTRIAAERELEKTWEQQKQIYPHRLRGLMLAFDEVDPTPYEEQLKPLVDHRDERTKQGAARHLQRIRESRDNDLP